MNAVETAVFGNLFASLCDEMGAALGRAAFSPNVKDRRDYSCALFDPRGRLVGQACHIPVHLGAMAYAVADVVAETPLGPGDVLILNDPYRGGTHLPDVTLIAPVHDGDLLLGYVANRAHHADVGGAEPGSMAPARSIDDEGLRIEPTLLFRAGVLQDGVVRRLRGAARTPEEREGDLRAQVAAIRTGAARLSALAGKYGALVLGEAGEALLLVAERHVRAALSLVPDGIWTFEDHLDGDGMDPSPIPIRVTLTVTGETAVVDFTGTAGPCAGNLNCPRSVTASALAYVLRCLVPDDCPANGGLLTPVRLVVPEGCLLDARYPAAVAAGNVETSQRVVDVLLGALAPALPHLIPAASCGSMNNVAVGGVDGAGRPFAYYETVAGGAGAGPRCEGRSAVHTHMTNTLNTPVESLEGHYPLRVVRYALRGGSGGEGARRGGDGVVREIEALVSCRLSLLGERRTTAPWGLAGGGPGLTGRAVIIGVDGVERELPGKVVVDLAPGERVRLETPGGGGHGAS